jgi:hypothetical protein
MIQQTQLSAAQARKMREDLERLPAMPEMADKIDSGERFAWLDVIVRMARDAAEKRSKLAGTIDWDLVVRQGNADYDRLVEAIRRPTRAQRKAVCDEIDLENREKIADSRDTVKSGLRMLANRGNIGSERLADMAWIVAIPQTFAAVRAAEHGGMELDLTKLAFALAAYRADMGVYPAKLADLTPKYVAQIPKDRFSDGDLHYSLQGGGYLLYSVGPNGQDDGGKGVDDCKAGNEPWDDITIRITKP